MNEIPAWCDPMHPDFDPADPRWVALSVEDRTSLYLAAQDAAVARRGYTCQAVFPVGDDGYHFAYTVGGPVSMIVTGVSASAQPFLDEAVAQADQPDGVPFPAGDSGYAMVFAPVPRGEFDEHCGAAKRHGAVTARQLLWQDDKHRWPWEEGHAHQIDGGAPVLAGADWRPQ